MYSFMGGGLFCAWVGTILLVVATATDHWMQYRLSGSFAHQGLWRYCLGNKCYLQTESIGKAPGRGLRRAWGESPPRGTTSPAVRLVENSVAQRGKGTSQRLLSTEEAELGFQDFFLVQLLLARSQVERLGVGLGLSE